MVKEKTMHIAHTFHTKHRYNLGSEKFKPFENIVLDPFVGIDVEAGDDPAECGRLLITRDFNVRARVPQNVPVFIQAVVSQA